MMRQITITMGSLLFTAAVYAQTWTLDDCMRYAAGHAVEVSKARLQIDDARTEVRHAVAQFFPQVGASTGGQYAWGRNVNPETNTYNSVTTFNNHYQLYAELSVFDGGQTLNAFRKAKTQRQQTMSALQKAHDDKMLEVMQCYADAAYNGQCVRLAMDRLADSQQLLVKVTRQEELGLKGHPDVALIEAQVAEDEYQLTHQQNQYRQTLLALKTAMNYPLGDSLRISMESHEQTPSSGSDLLLSAAAAGSRADALAVYSFAAQHHPGALSAQYQLQNARYDYAMSKGRLFPTVSVTAAVATSYYKTLSGGGTAPSFSRQWRDNLGEYVSATLSVPLFNYSHYKNIRKARNGVKTAQLEYEETLRKLHDDIVQAVMDCDGYGREVTQMTRKVAADSLAYQLSRRKYEEGMLSTFDLHTSANTLLESRIRLLQTQMLYMIKQRLVSYYRGESSL